jgi:hypothetical protein
MFRRFHPELHPTGREVEAPKVKALRNRLLLAFCSSPGRQPTSRDSSANVSSQVDSAASISFKISTWFSRLKQGLHGWVTEPVRTRIHPKMVQLTHSRSKICVSIFRPSRAGHPAPSRNSSVRDASKTFVVMKEYYSLYRR